MTRNHLVPRRCRADQFPSGSLRPVQNGYGSVAHLGAAVRGFRSGTGVGGAVGQAVGLSELYKLGKAIGEGSFGARLGLGGRLGV